MAHDVPIFLSNGWFVPIETNYNMPPMFTGPPPMETSPGYPGSPDVPASPGHVGGLTGSGGVAGSCSIYGPPNSCQTVALTQRASLATIIKMNPVVCKIPNAAFTKRVKICVPVAAVGK